MMPITPIVKNLLIINVLVFIGVQFLPDQIKYMMPFNPPGATLIAPGDIRITFQPYQIITHMFSHADISHIFFNMLSLFFLGPMVEMALGPKRFLGLYFISGFVALLTHFLIFNLPFLLGQSADVPNPILGASGAVYGVVIAFATLFPDRELMLLFPPIPIKAWVMALILIGIGLYSGLTGSGGNVAHFAHLGGALAGYLLASHWKRGGRFLS